MGVQSPLDKIEQDFQALARRVTANHILLPESTEVTVTPNKKICNGIKPRQIHDLAPMHVIDAIRSKILRGGADGAKTVYLGLNGKEEGRDVFRLTAEKLAFWILLLII